MEWAVGGRGETDQRLVGVQVYSWKCQTFYQNETTLERVSTWSKKDFKLDSLLLEPGLHYLQLSITNPNHPNAIGFDYGFVNITKATSLVVHIEGGNHRVIIENTVITLNGSGTFNPNLFRGPGEEAFNLPFPRCLQRYLLFINISFVIVILPTMKQKNSLF